MTLVEMIEALQKEWRKTSQIPNCNSFEEGYAKAHEWLAREIAPILAAAREQEDELAHWRWLYSDHGEPKKDSKPEQTQHSADLRALAEMCMSQFIHFEGVTPDSIVREFREKQKKSKEGDARESGSSS